MLSDACVIRDLYTIFLPQTLCCTERHLLSIGAGFTEIHFIALIMPQQE